MGKEKVGNRGSRAGVLGETEYLEMAATKEPIAGAGR